MHFDDKSLRIVANNIINHQLNCLEKLPEVSVDSSEEFDNENGYVKSTINVCQP